MPTAIWFSKNYSILGGFLTSIFVDFFGDTSLLAGVRYFNIMYRLGWTIIYCRIRFGYLILINAYFGLKVFVGEILSLTCLSLICFCIALKTRFPVQDNL